MKILEKRNTFKEEAAAVNKNPRELSEEELEQTTGGKNLQTASIPTPVAGPPMCFCGKVRFAKFCAKAQCTFKSNCPYDKECKNPGKAENGVRKPVPELF